MTARLILARHGNTFRPEEEPVWVGARSDFPLVDKGLAQARILGEALLAQNIRPDKIIAGPLQRTRQTAQIAAKIIGIPENDITIDTHLTEIDYGLWEGKANAAIIAMGHGEELEAWSKKSIFPRNAEWAPSEDQIITDVGALLTDATTDLSLIVTSNGILRFFARAASNKADFPDAKVATGNFCIMEREAQSQWHIACWNQPPETL